MALAVSALAPGWALADGDPASDVLASQSLFLPADGGFKQSDAAQLSGLLAAAQRAGVPIRVALISTPADLGSVGALWRKPQPYAQFLGQELSQVFRGTVVVVMPNGVGTYMTTKPGHDVVAVNPLRASPMRTAVVTVETLASHAGHRLPLPAAAAAAGLRLGPGLGRPWVVAGPGRRRRAHRRGLDRQPARPAGAAPATSALNG